jgi:pSer/pThr/pTyr-binding forkhead associated (FHA) protein
MTEGSECSLEIEFLSGPRDGEVTRLYSSDVIVGRGEGVDVSVASDTAVSGRHARIRCAGGEVSIEDLDSGRGTTVNGRKITDVRVVGNSDIICVGHTEFICRLPGSKSVAASATGTAAETKSGF